MLDQAKTLLKDLLGPLYEYLHPVAAALFRFSEPGHLHYMFFASAVLLAFWFHRKFVRRDQATWRWDFIRWLVPRDIFLHRSAIVDYQFYLINAIVHTKLITTLVVGLLGLFAVADGVRALLTAGFGLVAASDEPSIVVRLAYTVAMVLAVDFAKWYGHYLEHRIPFLWEFHKVHHSAEVLTPITNHRAHPVDSVFEQILVALVSGPVIGIFAWLHPQEVTEITLMNMGIIYVAYYITHNLRHSHIPVGYGWRASHFFSSPAMHQIHHSVEPRHWDKNFALIFSFWDALAGTNYIPREHEKFKLGLPGDENQRFRSVWALYVSPFGAVARRLRRAAGFGSSSA